MAFENSDLSHNSLDSLKISSGFPTDLQNKKTDESYIVTRCHVISLTIERTV